MSMPIYMAYEKWPFVFNQIEANAHSMDSSNSNNNNYETSVAHGNDLKRLKCAK